MDDIFDADHVTAPVSAQTAVSMSNVTEDPSKNLPEDSHEIHCDILSCNSPTSGTVSYVTVNPVINFDKYYHRKKKEILNGRVMQCGHILREAKEISFSPSQLQPLRCKVNPKLLKMLDARQKRLRKNPKRGHKFFKVIAVELPAETKISDSEEDLIGVGVVEAHRAALTEFIASKCCAFSTLTLKAKFDCDQNLIGTLDIDVIDERAGKRNDEPLQRLKDSDVRRDFYASQPVRTESLASVLTESSTLSHDTIPTTPIKPRSYGILSRIFHRLTFGIFAW